MHELGIAERLLEVVLERAAAAGAGRVTTVYLEIGAESDLAPEALEHYWPQVSHATPAGGAQLVLGVAPASDPFACRVVAIDVPDGAS